MQFPVPQFTEVEDRIIGPFTLKQFLIVGGTGLCIFLIYSATKSMVILVFACILFGGPALFIAFGKHSGMPLYKALPRIIHHFFAPKLFVFHKESKLIHTISQIQALEMQKKPVVEKIPEADKRQKLKDISLFLERKALEEEVVAKNPEQFAQKKIKLSDIFK